MDDHIFFYLIIKMRSDNYYKFIKFLHVRMQPKWLFSYSFIKDFLIIFVNSKILITFEFLIMLEIIKI